MAHPEQEEFILYVKKKFPNFFREKFVVDFGSLDVTGNNRKFFSDDCGYIGVDLNYGKNVDIVCKAHELNLPDSTFDVVISTEMLEHDPFYKKSILNMYRLLKPGGLFIITCATEGRPEHGTINFSPNDAPFIAYNPKYSNYYRNITEEDIREVLDIEKSFSMYEFKLNKKHHDLYFWGIKRGKFKQHNGYSFLIYREQKCNLRDLKRRLSRNVKRIINKLIR